MIKVGSPTLARIEDMTILSVSVDNGYDGTLSDLTFTFESSYENGLAIDRADGLLVCMLHWLAAHNYDVTFDLPISERLYYQITEFIIPALKRATKVYCPSMASPLPRGKYVGTGMTCGVDSLTTFKLNVTKDIPAENKVNILTFFDAGTFAGHNAKADITLDRNGNLIGDASIRASETFQNSKKFADEVGLPLFYIRSNLGQVLKYKEFQPQEFSFTLNGCILLFQKMFRIYYFSSTRSLDDFGVDREQLLDTSRYDVFTMPMISTDILTFYSAGSPYSRLEKTSLIAADKLAQKYLSVCTGSAHNCGYCDKCTRTILSLEALGSLDCFSEVFDLERYSHTRTKQIGKVIARKFTRDVYLTPIYSMLKKQHKIPWLSYIWALIFLAMNPFTRMFKNMDIETKNKLRRWGVKHNLINPFH